MLVVQKCTLGCMRRILLKADATRVRQVRQLAAFDDSSRLASRLQSTPPHDNFVVQHVLGLHCYHNYMGVIQIFNEHEDLPDLAPNIYRQRLVIEGYCPKPITAEQIECYFRVLSVVCGMVRLNDPVTHSSDKYGWAGWVHWEASGAHLYAWEDPLLFFSVDIYTCAEFDTVKVTEFTSAFFAAGKVVAKDF